MPYKASGCSNNNGGHESLAYMHTRISLQQISQMDKRPRVQLVNSLPGLKSAHLIGTINKKGQTNLAIFSSVTHLGSNPPYFGFITRPTAVPRHTYLNIQETRYFTINHIHKEMYRQAHQTSARYDVAQSEFEATGLTPDFKEDFPAPYVAESHIRMGLKLKEEYQIKANDTVLVIGELLEIWLPEESIQEDGYIDTEAAGSLGVSGLDSYHSTERLARLAYAKVGKEPDLLKPDQ